MELVKNCVDVGLFTNRLEEMRSFYGDRLKLPYEELLPVGSGVQQHRYGLLGSVLKINHSRDPLPPRVGGGYRRISIADPRTPMPLMIEDPDGTAIELVPSGQRGIDQIEVQLGATDEASFERFYCEAFGCERLGTGRYKLGRTILSLVRDPQATRAKRADAGSGVQALDSMRAIGFRYITVQVRDCDAEYHRLIAMGVWAGAAPVTFGKVARICFVGDPDGNWIEISQRASLTGKLPE